MSDRLVADGDWEYDEQKGDRHSREEEVNETPEQGCTRLVGLHDFG